VAHGGKGALALLVGRRVGEQRGLRVVARALDPEEHFGRFVHVHDVALAELAVDLDAPLRHACGSALRRRKRSRHGSLVPAAAARAERSRGYLGRTFGNSGWRKGSPGWRRPDKS
jgi:hypothetical protein